MYYINCPDTVPPSGLTLTRSALAPLIQTRKMALNRVIDLFSPSAIYCCFPILFRKAKAIS